MRYVEVCMLLVEIPLHFAACRNILFLLLTEALQNVVFRKK